MSDAEVDRKRRKKNFSSEERAILTSAIGQYDAYLHGTQSAMTSKAQKKEIYEKITLEVNALGHETRTSKDIIKKINDMRRRVREKLAKVRKHLRGTGGGPTSSMKLTAEEEVIASCLEEEKVEGLAGFDSSDQDLRRGKCVLSPIWCGACEGVQGNM